MPTLPRDIDLVDVDAIHVGHRLRQATNPDRVAALASSIKEIGMLNPVSIRTVAEMVIDGTIEHDVPVLVAGMHRLEAAKSLGLAKVPCIEIGGDDLEAQLWEVDENLCRTELTAAEIAEHTTKRAEIWAEMEKRRGNTVPTLHKAAPGQKGFAADTAAKTGQNKRTINEALQRGKSIAPDVLQSVKGTALDKGVELDALAKKPHEEQRQIVARVRAGTATSARIPQTRDEDDMATIADQDMARILKRYTVGQFQDWFDRINERAPILIKQRMAA